MQQTVGVPTTTLHLVRHGAADAETSTDSGLTPEGLRQADAAGHALRDAEVDTVFHSSRRRAAETAQAIASSLGARTEISDLFEDRTPIPEDWASVPSQYREFLHHVPDDEADHGARDLTLAVRHLSEVGQGDQTIVAVTHNFVIGWFVRAVLDAPWWRWIGLNQDNGAITTIRWSRDREPRLLAFNERGHLARV